MLKNCSFQKADRKNWIYLINYWQLLSMHSFDGIDD